MTWRPNVTVAAVIERDGHYLLVEERDGAERVLNQPAGHLEEGESLTDAVRREVLEETAHHFSPEALVGIYQLRAANGTSYLRFCFCGGVDGRDDRALDPDILHLHWLDRGGIEARSGILRSPLVLAAIADYEAGARLPLGALRALGPLTP